LSKYDIFSSKHYLAETTAVLKLEYWIPNILTAFINIARVVTKHFSENQQ
jgi:hypothetical protein